MFTHYLVFLIALASVRTTIEHVNSRLRRFGVFDRDFRHGEKKHKLVMNVVCKLVNHWMIVQPVQQVLKTVQD